MAGGFGRRDVGTGRGIHHGDTEDTEKRRGEEKMEKEFGLLRVFLRVLRASVVNPASDSARTVVAIRPGPVGARLHSIAKERLSRRAIS
jgi:hypothetical protein